MSIAVEDSEVLGHTAARWVAQRILAEPSTVLAVPSGDTPAGMYQKLVEMCHAELLSFGATTAFILDEYYGLPNDHPRRCLNSVKTQFFDRVGLPEERRYALPSAPPDPAAACAEYEEQVRRADGVDLAVLGIGLNGHIGFNEPGSPLESETRLVRLAEQTVQRMRPAFSEGEEVPTQGLTMGIKTIMRARRILLLAEGGEKADVVCKALLGPVGASLPASVLQLHPCLTVIVDRAAAAKLNCDVATPCERASEGAERRPPSGQAPKLSKRCLRGREKTGFAECHPVGPTTGSGPEGGEREKRVSGDADSQRARRRLQ